MAALDEAGHHPLAEVRGDGESDALIATRAAENLAVDADETTLGIDERAAGVAGVDGGIGLDEILVHAGVIGAVLGADDALGHGLAEAKRIANGEHHVAHGGFAAVGEG